MFREVENRRANCEIHLEIVCRLSEYDGVGPRPPAYEMNFMPTYPLREAASTWLSNPTSPSVDSVIDDNGATQVGSVYEMS